MASEFLRIVLRSWSPGKGGSDVSIGEASLSFDEVDDSFYMVLVCPLKPASHSLASDLDFAIFHDNCSDHLLSFSRNAVNACKGIQSPVPL